MTLRVESDDTTTATPEAAKDVQVDGLFWCPRSTELHHLAVKLCRISPL